MDYGFNPNLRGCKSIAVISRYQYSNKQHVREGEALMPISYSASLTSLEKDIKSNVTFITYNTNMSLPFNQFPLDLLFKANLMLLCYGSKELERAFHSLTKLEVSLSSQMPYISLRTKNWSITPDQLFNKVQR